MSLAHADLIKNAMSNFCLPASATPPWAKVVPEEVWKRQLKESLVQQKRPPDAKK